jgi:hypothetical protein
MFVFDCLSTVETRQRQHSSSKSKCEERRGLIRIVVNDFRQLFHGGQLLAVLTALLLRVPSKVAVLQALLPLRLPSKVTVRQGLLPLVVNQMNPVRVHIRVTFRQTRALLLRVSRRLVRPIRLTVRHARGPRVPSPLSFIRALLVRMPSRVAVRRTLLLPVPNKIVSPLWSPSSPSHWHSAELELSFYEFLAVWYGPSDWQSVMLEIHECPARCHSYELCY